MKRRQPEPKPEPKVERQELWCHNCSHYVQFNVDMALDGNHVLECPNCKHEHCRVVKRGKITEDRWDTRNGQNTYYVSGSITTSTTSTFQYYMSNSTANSNIYLYGAWMNTTS